MGYSFHDLSPPAAGFREDVMAGLAARPKRLPPKYFYDARGAALFEAICELPEYYPTRTELALMHAHAADMARLAGPDCLLIEYGSGATLKTRVLLEHLRPLAYVPVDIAAGQLRQCAGDIAERFPALHVMAVCADYSFPLVLPELDVTAHRRRLIYFPGSTIGNLTVDEARLFLANAHRLAGRGGAMLVGVDLKKDTALLHAAYNDAQGVTARFNLNLLARINRELDGDFKRDAFRHYAFYNPAEGRVEMHLCSLPEQQVTVAGERFHFARGECLHTENSYKYSVGEFRQLARAAGFEPREVWVDGSHLFAVHYLEAGG